jgi:hypothetical protein
MKKQEAAEALWRQTLADTRRKLAAIAAKADVLRFRGRGRLLGEVAEVLQEMYGESRLAASLDLRPWIAPEFTDAAHVANYFNLAAWSAAVDIWLGPGGPCVRVIDDKYLVFRLNTASLATYFALE